MTLDGGVVVMPDGGVAVMPDRGVRVEGASGSGGGWREAGGVRRMERRGARQHDLVAIFTSCVI